MAESVIFEVNIQDALTKLSNLQAAIELNKQAQQSYQEVVKSGADVSGEAAKQLENLKVANKNLGSEYRSAQRLLEGYTGAQKDNIDTTNFANNSVRQNRLLLKQLTEQYNDASAAARNTLAPSIKRLSDELKSQESAIGDNRRSVGGYAEGIQKAFGELKIGNVQLSTLQDGLKGATNSFKAAGGGVKGFSAALATTGLPLIILGVQQLINVFEKFEPVADAVEDATTAVSAAFNALINGGNIAEATKQSLALLEVMRDLEDTQEGFNLQIERQRAQVEKLIIQSKDRTKSEEERIKLINEAEALEKKIYNETLKRNDIALKEQEANLIQKSGLTKKELQLLAETSNAEDENYKKVLAKFEDQTEIGKKELKQYQQTLQERAKLDGEQNKNLEKLINSRNKIAEKEEEQQKKANEKAAQEREKQKAAEEKYRNDIAKLQEEFNLSERQKLEKSFTDKVNLIKGNNAQELALIDTINKAKEKALKKFDEDAAKREDDLQKERIDKQRQRAIQAINERATLNQTLYENEVKRAELEIKNDEELAREKERLALFNLERQLDTLKQLAAVDGDITDQELANIEKLKLAIKSLKEEAAKPSERTLADAIGVSKEQQEQINEGLAVISQSVSAIGEVINSAYQVRLNDIEAVKNAEIAAINASGASAEQKTKKVQEAEKKAAMEAYEIQKKQFETNKTIAIIQTVINTAQAVMAQLANPTPYVGIVLAALAAATGAAQIAVIASQKPPAPPAFADGGKVLSGQMIGASDGKPIHRGNGDNLLATVKTGEVILNQRQQAALGGAATFRKIGVPGFASGGLVGDGGFAARGMTRASEDRSFMTAAIRSGFATAPQPIVSVEEFNKVSSSSQRSVAVSEL